MPRKNRDYKAEYAAAKRRATAAGYKSPREYKSARKALKVPRNASPIPKRIAETQSPGVVSSANANSNRLSRMRKRSRDWSAKHSRTRSSRYDSRMSDDTVERYYRAFVEPITEGSRRGKARERRQRIRDWLVPDWLSESEWEGKYQPSS